MPALPRTFAVLFALALTQVASAACPTAASQPAACECQPTLQAALRSPSVLQAAARSGVAAGDVIVEFTIQPDGVVSDIAVAEASHPALADAVRKGLRGVGPCAGGRSEVVRLRVPMRFRF